MNTSYLAQLAPQVPLALAQLAAQAAPNQQQISSQQPTQVNSTQQQTQQATQQPYVVQQPQRSSSTLPQTSQQQPPNQLQQPYQQFPQNYYPDQYQQYQQLLNGANTSNQSYYYMNQQQQQQQPQQQPQPQQPQHQSTNAPQYPYGAAPYNYSLYQQSIPQSQISQPQPQHYNQLPTGSSNPAAAATAVAASAPTTAPTTANTNYTASTPIQTDTLNTANTSTVGQYQPPGIRPRVTTTMWEDEKTLCYQVDANNVSVVRRADNNMINGTKLLNVAQMTRGRRDGILKLEKVRHVVKIGSMHLKGVWIPFERALAMAQREGIVDLLYPLFVRDIKRVIQTGVTPAASAAANSNQLKQSTPITQAATANLLNNGTPATTNPNPNVAAAQLSSYYQQYSYPNGAASTNTNQNNSTAAGGSANTPLSTHATKQSPIDSRPQQSSPTTTTGNLQQLPQQAPNAPQPTPGAPQYQYQQPYYPNQYYQPYPNNNYSSYGGQPVYPGYQYLNQNLPQPPPPKSEDGKKK
ncbi:apses-domain-containing protein [Hyphopichia burtonii NRRL Y-1933]|uniref:Apses-domain-containing protein n=1 Tax=Hyphopichia burtonii NRRL Y-1933 TaxID=984485 RepID=A0A1E4RD91_9ASCO|nr:apses-domain-containing protein [Hyphopichia burtonii NRRL Y-1933]ODV65095.1 apses-domain-containing protein [Hyphopichia burtonii NRRL Y-1933]